MQTVLVLPYSLIFAGFGVLLVTLLALNVSRLRIQKGIVIGDGGYKPMVGAMRAHENTLEWIIPLLLLLMLLEASGLSASRIIFFGVALLIARLAHAAGMIWRIFTLRRIGALVSYLLAVAMSIAALVQGFNHLNG